MKQLGFRAAAIVALAIGTTSFGASPRNVILFIGDGMGFEQVKAAGHYLHGAEGTLVFESFPHTAASRTAAADGSVTDSAASGTAMATGRKANNGVISMAYPGDGHELETALEYYKLRGRSVGLVTTTYLTHATPACFGAHEPSRDSTARIARDYLRTTRPDLLLGGGGNGMTPASAEGAGYVTVLNRADLLALDTETVSRLCGQFGTSHFPYEHDGYSATYPHLSEMMEVALSILDNDPDGFFLMVEGGRIDHACHANDLPRAVEETVEFDAAVQSALDWVGSREDTLIVVTADHETGGLSVVEGSDEGELPTVTWSTGGHTGADVPVYATGPNAELVTGVMENTVIFEITTCQWPSSAGIELRSADEIRVLWGRAGPGAVYTVESVDSLAGEWSAAPSADPWPTSESSWGTTLAPGTGAAYYRVRADGVTAPACSLSCGDLSR